MRTTLVRTAGGFMALALLGAVPPAKADILDDILGITTAARDRATEARNNAASARDRATEARNNAAAARDTAITARDTAIEMRDTMRSGIDALAAGVRTMIDEAADDLEQDISDEMAGRDAFVNGGGAETFRQQLLELISNSETFLNALNSAAGGQSARADFAREAAMIDALPARTLYPLHRALVAEAPGVLEWFNELLARASDDILVIEGLLTESSEVVDGDLLDQELSDCSYVLDHLAEIRQATGDLTKFALAARGFGTLLKAAGTTEIHKTGAVWGWVGVSLKNNRVKKLGVMVDGMGTVVSGLTSYVSTKTRYCAAIGVEGEAREREREILLNQRKILDLLQSPSIGRRP